MQLPPVTRSLRFRLSGLTSALVFSVAGLALAVIYFVTLRAVQSLTVTSNALEPVLVDGERLAIRLTQVEMRTIESLIKEVVLNQLAVWTVGILLALFALSLIVGWIVASRSLRPIDEISDFCGEISRILAGRLCSRQCPVALKVAELGALGGYDGTEGRVVPGRLKRGRETPGEIGGEGHEREG